MDLFGAKQLPEPMLTYCQLDSWEHISVKYKSDILSFLFKKMQLKMSPARMASILSKVEMG